MSAVYLPPERVRYWRDRDNVLSIAKLEDATVPLTIDWSDRLGPSVVINDVSYDDSGVSHSDNSNTDTVSTAMFTGLGSTIATATTSAGETWRLMVRFYAESGSGQTSDYDD